MDTVLILSSINWAKCILSGNCITQSSIWEMGNKKVNVYRWSPSDGKNPRIDTFEVDMDNCGPKVLDILFKIKNEIDPSLTFRRSCAHGVCGCT